MENNESIVNKVINFLKGLFVNEINEKEKQIHISIREEREKGKCVIWPLDRMKIPGNNISNTIYSLIKENFRLVDAINANKKRIDFIEGQSIKIKKQKPKKS